jgi:oxygen-independent coproporphyrinogen-3 oxidase
MVKDGLVSFRGNEVKVSPEGVPFVRNVCMAFDQDLKQNIQRTNLFSKTV